MSKIIRVNSCSPECSVFSNCGLKAPFVIANSFDNKVDKDCPLEEEQGWVIHGYILNGRFYLPDDFRGKTISEADKVITLYSHPKKED